jgi:hypothetical protein
MRNMGAAMATTAYTMDSQHLLKLSNLPLKAVLRQLFAYSK